MKKSRHRRAAPRAPSKAIATPADLGHVTTTGARVSASYEGGPRPTGVTRYAGGGGAAYTNAHPNLFGRGNLAFGMAQSGNMEIVRERRQAVVNARVVDRNNAMMHAGITKRATNLVGTNLKLRSMPNWRALAHPTCDAVWAAEFAEAYENLFSLWGDDSRCLCDAERHLQFGGLIHMAARNTYGADGETMLHIRASEERRQRYGGKFRTFIEVVDPDRISNPTFPRLMTNNRFLSEGRVLDEWGAAIGFWVETRHPSDAIGRREWVYVPRETEWGRPVGVHWFPKHRSGVQRAMPAILQSLRDVKMLDKFDDHTLKAAALGAFMSMYVKSDAASADVLKRLMTAAPTGDRNELEALWDLKFGLYDDLNLVADGQQIPILPPGDEIMTNVANRAADNTEPFHYIFERKMAQNLQLGTANFTGDYSKTSFASIRADFMDAWRDTLAVRHQFTQHTAAPVNFALMEECLSRGMLPMPRNAPNFYENASAYTQSEFRGPAMGTIDPVKDPTGAGISIQGGFSTPQGAAAERGGDLYENIDEIADAQAYATRKGVTLKWGQAQGGDANADDNADTGTTTPAREPANAGA